MHIKTLALFTALVIASGCGTASMEKRLDTLEQQLRQARAENGELEQKLAETAQVSDDGTLPPTDAEAQAPASPAPQGSDLLTGQQAMTLADSNPGVFQCFLDRDPGLGGGHWMAIENAHRYAVELAINSQPVVVYEPIGSLWRKVKIFSQDGPLRDDAGRQFFSIIPKGKKCYAPMPGRFTGEHEATYALSGVARVKDVNSIGPMSVYSGQHAGRIKDNAYLTKRLKSGRVTYVRLDRFDFN